VLGVEDWAEIRRLRRAEGMPILAIASVMGVSRNTVKRALVADGPPRYQRPVRGSIVDAVEPQIRELLGVWPSMPATVVAERIGWQRWIRVLGDRVAELRPVYLPPDPASRTTYQAGELAQCDLWFPEITLPVGFGQVRTATRLPVLVMVSGYSRWLSARLVPSRTAEDLFAGWWQLLAELGGVSKALVWDQEGAVGKRRRRVRVLTEPAHAFRGVLGTKVVILDAADPEAKGLVERANGYLETSFLYSVDPSVIGRRVEVSADLDRVRVYCDGRLVADHGRCWARHQTITDPDHARAPARLGADHPSTTRGEPAEIELRCLTDYDTALGLTDGAA
jgi:transposase